MKVVTAWNVENARPGDDAPEVPMTWPRQCLACVQHAVSMDNVEEAEGMVIADWTPWVGQWVPMCASGVANHRRHKRPVAVPAAFDRERGGDDE